MLILTIATLAITTIWGLYTTQKMTQKLNDTPWSAVETENETAVSVANENLPLIIGAIDGPVVAWMPVLPLWQIPQNWWTYLKWTPTATPTAPPTAPAATATPKPINPPAPTATATPKPTTQPMPTATAAPNPTSTPAQTTDIAVLQQYSLDLHNAARAANGVAPLVLDAKLNTAAMGHAKDMATYNYFSHTGRDGSQPWDRMARAGATWSTAGENIGNGSGYGTTLDGIKRMIQANFNAMMAETPPNDGHRKNILNSNFHKLGVGIASDANGKTYWVCDFTN
jgi:uncharacterized protein YkwD